MKLLRWARVLLLLAALGAGYARLRIDAPLRGLQPGEHFIDFPKGTSTPEIANRLAHAGVIAACVGVPGGARAPSAAHAAGRRVSLRQTGLGARGLRPHRARRRVLLRAGRSRRPEYVRYRGGGRKAEAVSGGGFSARGARPVVHPRSRSRGAHARRLPVPQHLPGRPPHHPSEAVPADDGALPRSVEADLARHTECARCRHAGLADRAGSARARRTGRSFRRCSTTA